jgi:uncharacterized protein YkwD
MCMPKLVRLTILLALGAVVGWWLLQPATRPLTHTVRPGESLAHIAAEYETSVDALIALNADRFPRLGEAPEPSVAAGWRLVVAPVGQHPRWQVLASTAEAELRPLIDSLRAAAPQPPNGLPIGTAPAATSPQLAQLEASLVDQTNAVRAAAGLATLETDPALTTLARQRSQDMVDRDYFSHHDPDTGEALLSAYCIRPLRLRACGENLAASTSYADLEANAVDRWMDSEGHRENILRPEWGRIGIGLARGGRWGFVVTQLFAP